MLYNCPKCHHPKIDIHKNYCCPECGEKFYSSIEQFKKELSKRKTAEERNKYIKNKQIKIAIKCITICLMSGFILGIIFGSVASVYSVFKNGTSDGKYVTQTYCVEYRYTGTETCDNYNNCIRDTECIGGWENKNVPIAIRIKENLETYLTIFISIGVLIGLLTAGYYYDRIKNEEFHRKREEEELEDAIKEVNNE